MKSSGIDTEVKVLHDKVKELLKNKWSEDAIVHELSKDGIDAFYARTIIENIQNDRSDNKNFWKLIFGGTFFIIGGLLINYFSYQSAVNSNSWFFYLFWGIVVLGIVTICKAFIIFRKR